MSTSERIKLFIILIGPALLIALVIGLFIIKVDGLSLIERFKVVMFG